MCGRYALRLTPADIEERFGFVELVQLRIPVTLPRFNIAPSQYVPVVVDTDEGRALRFMRWGFRPRWVKAGSRPPPINARAESLLERPMFRGAVGKGRCLIPATGFYEWQSIPGAKSKLPWHFRLRDGEPYGFAGLWTDDADGEPTCAIVTTEANALVAPVHDRMPVILLPEAEGDWLDREERGRAALLGLLRPYPADRMEAYPVSAAVSSVANDSPELIRPVG